LDFPPFYFCNLVGRFRGDIGGQGFRHPVRLELRPLQSPIALHDQL
jgi:hypothetical protein